MEPAAHGQDTSPDLNKKTSHGGSAPSDDSPVTETQVLRRFIPTTKESRKAGARGYEHHDHGRLQVKTLQPGEQHDVRLLPCHIEYLKGRRFLKFASHEWSPSEYNPLRVRAVCPEQTDRELLEIEKINPCPACAAGVDVSKAAIVYALVDGQPMCLKFTEKNFHVLNQLKVAGCFDLQLGRIVRLWNDNWELDFKLLQVDPIDPNHFDIALQSEALHTRTWQVRYDLLAQMALARAGWLKAGEVEPRLGQVDPLVKLLPGCTLIPIPWGMKGPQAVAWQNTSNGMMASLDYQINLGFGNIGLLCGRDQVAIDRGLVPDRVVVGLDADDDVFAGSLRQLNPWLDNTFAVEGGRGLKWFFAVQGKGVERCLRSTKIMQRGADKDREVGDWLAVGKQGVVWGLHPSGKMYKPNWKPMQTINIKDFQLPKSCFLPSQQVRLSTPAEQYRKSRGRFGEASAGAILDLDRLTNVHGVDKGTGAACPACQDEGKDSAGDNLLIYPAGQFKCARFINCSDEENHQHNQEIYRLAGKGGSTDEA